jgi:hypothetical protein
VIIECLNCGEILIDSPTECSNCGEVLVPVDYTVYWDAVYLNWGHRSSVRRESLLRANVATLALVVIVVTLGSLLVHLGDIWRYL